MIRSIVFLLTAIALLVPGAVAGGLKYSNTDYTGMDLRGRSFAGARISNVQFNNANLANVDFTGARISNVSFIGSNLRGACFLNSRLSNSKFANADLGGAVLVGVNSKNTDYGGAKVDQAIWDGRAECKIVSSPVSPPRRGHGKRVTNSDFARQNLRGRDFSGVKFSNVKFLGANLEGANFSNSVLRNVQFDNAVLRSACFENAEMSNVTFSGADLSDAVLLGARERNTDYNGATMKAAGKGPCASVQKASTASRPEVTSAAAIEKALVKKENVDLTINFEVDSDQIHGRGHKQVLEIANALRSPKLAGVRIGVEGHTDADGSDEYNDDLSYRRAITVVRVLAEKYDMDRRRFQVEGYGESRPVAPNQTEQGKALNRRVTLVNLGAS